jgi:hypothetical protein
LRCLAGSRNDVTCVTRSRPAPVRRSAALPFPGRAEVRRR